MNTLDKMRRDIWQPQANLSPVEWVLENVKAIPYSPLPNFDPDLRPALKTVLEVIADPRVNLVVLLCAVQNWKSLAIELSITKFIKTDPHPIGFIMKKDAEARGVMTTRFMPLWRNTPVIQALMPTGADRNEATKSLITFKNQMVLWCMGSAESNLQGKTIRTIFFDDAFQFDRGVIKTGKARLTGFRELGKAVIASQGSQPGHEVEENWEETSQSEWSFRCQSCQTMQAFTWKQIKFDPIKDESGRYNYKEIRPTVELECINEECKHRYKNTDAVRQALSDPKKGARFIKGNPRAPDNKIGLRETAISTMCWFILVEEYLQAKLASYRGDFTLLQIFHTKRLASFFGDEAGEDEAIQMTGAGYNAADWEEWQDDLEQWHEGLIAEMPRTKVLRIVESSEKLRDALTPKGNKVWHRLRFLTVDVQRDHLWAIIRSYQPDYTSRLLWAGKLYSWPEVKLLQEQYEVSPGLTFLDSGDKPFAEQGVYEQAIRYGYSCLRGDRADSYRHAPKNKGDRPLHKRFSEIKWADVGGKRRVRVRHFSALKYRDQLQRLLKTPSLFQTPDDLEKLCDVYGDQMSSQRRGKTRTGKPTWITYGSHGEHLPDCEVMQLVGADITGLGSADGEEEAAEG